MRVRVYVEFIVDEEDTTSAEVEVEAQLNDMIGSNSATVISGFTVMDSESIETENEDSF